MGIFPHIHIYGNIITANLLQGKSFCFVIIAKLPPHILCILPNIRKFQIKQPFPYRFPIHRINRCQKIAICRAVSLEIVRNAFMHSAGGTTSTEGLNPFPTERRRDDVGSVSCKGLAPALRGWRLEVRTVEDAGPYKIGVSLRAMGIATPCCGTVRNDRNGFAAGASRCPTKKGGLFFDSPSQKSKIFDSPLNTRGPRLLTGVGWWDDMGSVSYKGAKAACGSGVVGRCGHRPLRGGQDFVEHRNA